MKILVIADRNPHINIEEVVTKENIELVITLGDLTREDILGLERVTHIPKIGVYGNHDSGNYMGGLGIWDMHRKIWSFNGLSFGGFQGCVRYKDNPDAIMCTQAEATQLMQGYPRVDVFLSHCPPRGINDEEEIAHQGFDALREYLDIQKPSVWLHGHTYPTDETIIKQHGPTRIEYVFKYRIIEL
jgi:Icc-related predicted phosphoesterase